MRKKYIYKILLDYYNHRASASYNENNSNITYNRIILLCN